MPIHPTAIVSPKAEIDSSADIGPHAIIEAPARIGPNVQIMANAVIGPWTEIGANSRIHFGAVIGHEPQHLAYKGEERWTCIGERTEIREYATIHRAFVEGGATRIGNDVLLMGLSHVGHDCKVGDRVILANGSLLAGHCEIGNGVVISGLSCTHQFVRVGRLAMIGGGSGARKDVPPFMTVSGVSTIRGLNVVGMRRAGFDPDVRQAIRAAYKTLYRKGLPVTAALNEIKSGEMIPEVREMVEFIEASKRGICRHYRRGSGESDD
jgi:UDP-N-acetylglucosamine acyltransferase